MKLFKQVFHGAILKRVEDFVNERAPTVRVVSLNDLSHAIGQETKPPKEHFLSIRQDKELPFVQKGDLVFGLTAHQSMVVEAALDGALLSSNFVKLELDENYVDRYFMMWFINQSQDFRRLLEKLKQGSITKSLSIEGLRDLKTELPSIEKQELIGNLYRLELKRIKLNLQKHRIYKQYLKSLYQEKGNK